MTAPRARLGIDFGTSTTVAVLRQDLRDRLLTATRASWPKVTGALAVKG